MRREHDFEEPRYVIDWDDGDKARFGRTPDLEECLLRLDSWIERVGDCLDDPKFGSVLVRWIEQAVHRLRHDCTGNPKQGTFGPLQPGCSQIAGQF
jgi:hypothetical protein